MGLLTVPLLLVRRFWAWARRKPLPQVAARPGTKGKVRRFVDGLGKVKAPALVTPILTAVEVDEWRSAAEAVKRQGVEEGPEPDCEVLVVGAGPSGLMTAVLLARQGVRVRVIDKNAGPATESRAFAVQARTVELFRNIGLAEELMGRGVVVTGIKFHIKGKPVGGLDFDRARAATTPYQFILMAPQAEIEDLLLQDLASQGVTVERGTRLVSLSQTDKQVMATVRQNDRERVISARYMVGADGSHSTVREQLGLAFEGDRYTQRYLLADCQVDWPFDHSHFRIFANGGRIGIFLPLKGSDVSRVMVTDRTPGTGPGDLGELQEELREAMRVPVTLTNPVWTSRYQVHIRKVEDYRSGRVFLVGDTAHIHSPAGGQGMNTGLHDAANLAWKLAAVLRTGAAAALLDSYDQERHPVGVQVLRFSDRLYKLSGGLRGWRAWVRDTVGPFLIGRITAAPLPHRKAFHRLSQISIAYEPSTYNVNELLYSLKGPLAGHRAPDARINAGGQMFDLLRGYRLHVVALSRKHLTDAEITELAAQLNSIKAFGGNVATHVVGRVQCRRDDRVEHVDSPQVFEHYGLTDPESQALYVIRPDGHVAWRMDTLDFESCRRFLVRLHGGIAACEEYRLAAVA